jgi:hypothetical protein
MNAEMLRKRRRRYSGKPWWSRSDEVELIVSIPLDLYWIIATYGLPVDVCPSYGMLSLAYEPPQLIPEPATFKSIASFADCCVHDSRFVLC